MVCDKFQQHWLYESCHPNNVDSAQDNLCALREITWNHPLDSQWKAPVLGVADPLKHSPN